MWDYINPAQYSAYKEWLEKCEKAEDELFRKDWNLDDSEKEYFDFVNYLEEISLLDDMWYKEYVKDFIERHGDDIDEYYRDEDDYDDDR